MTEVVEAIYENGVFKPKEPVALPEHTHVRVRFEPLASAPQTDDPLFARTPEDREAARKELMESFKTMSLRSGGRRFTREQMHERD